MNLRMYVLQVLGKFDPASSWKRWELYKLKILMKIIVIQDFMLKAHKQVTVKVGQKVQWANDLQQEMCC